MLKHFYLILLFITITSTTFAQGTVCDAADPFCSDAAFSFPNNFSGDVAEVGPDYGCLSTVPNPAWYFLYINNNGTLNFSISQVDLAGNPIDVDFIAYGPFTDLNNTCTTQLIAANIIACGYSRNATENFTIPNANIGEYYLVLITNFSGEEGNITFQQTNAGQTGSGSTDCSIICTVELVPDETICINTDFTITTTLGNTAMEASATYKWYKDGVLIPNETNSTLTVSSATEQTNNYSVEINADNCQSNATNQVSITFLNPFTGLELTNINELNACDVATTGIATYNLKDNELQILNGNLASDFKFTYYRDANFILPIDNPESYENNLLGETIYIKIESTNVSTCYETTSFQINKIISPRFDVIESQTICTNISTDTVTFTAENPLLNTYDYSWKDENDVEVSTSNSFTSNIPGIYTVTATDNSTPFTCTTTKTFEIIGINAAVITDTIINEYYVNDVFSLEILITGLGEYEFALNDPNGTYQDENKFTNLLPGIYTIYVREKNGCGITEKEIAIFGFPKFFTPNDDGINDIWTINDIRFLPNAKITIYNRFGMVLYIFQPANNQGWNGTFNNKLLPPTDYWFTAEMTNRFGKPILRKGHFSLIK